jgi:hypothetical protein
MLAGLMVDEIGNCILEMMVYAVLHKQAGNCVIRPLAAD